MGHSSIQITVGVYGTSFQGEYRIRRPPRPISPQEFARQPQESSGREFEEFKKVLKNEWLGGRDSNPDTQIQSLQSYR
jgi:hypothetical protein